MEESLTFVGFSDQLASKASTPGGGGASAAVGALSCALGQMVCNLTLGKQKYADVQDEIQQIVDALETERHAMLDFVDEDAEAFKPLAKAYSIPKDDPTYDEVMQAALKRACEPPVHIMEHVVTVIGYLERLAKIGSRMALSDVGVAATFARAALEGASLNVYINAASLTDRALADDMLGKVETMLAEAGAKAQGVFDSITEELKG